MKREIKEGIRSVEKLVDERKYKEAYNLCNKLLLNFPESSALKNLSKKIEKTVFKKNVKSVKQDLDKLKPLWGQGKYKDLVEKLKVLRGYVPGYGPVEKQLLKADKLYQEQVRKEIKNYYNNKLKEIKELLSKKEYEKAYLLAKELYRRFSKQEGAKNILEKSRDLYINDRLNKNKALLSGYKFDQIESFLNNLLKINPDSKKVKTLLKKAMKRERISLDFKEREFVYKSYERILTLYQKKKYEATLKALEELLSFEPDNLKALELHKKTSRKFDRYLTKEVIEKIKRLQKKFKREYISNKKDFIKI